MPGDSRNSHARIQQRLLQGDPTASEALVRECLAAMVRTLRRRHPVIPRDMLADAACDALISHIQAPARYDPARSGLLTFLTLIAERRLVDQVRVARRRATREIYVGAASDVEDWSDGHFVCVQPPALVDASAVGYLSHELEQIVALALPDPTDRELLSLICQGPHPVDEYAALLGLTHLPISDQRAQIKRSRDRVLNRLRRRREEISRLRSRCDE